MVILSQKIECVGFRKIIVVTVTFTEGKIVEKSLHNMPYEAIKGGEV